MQVPSSSSSQPALSVLVLLPATAHMAAQEASPLAPISRPSPLISRKSGSTVPSLKSLNNLQTPYTSRLRNDDMSPDGERHTVDPLIHAQVQAGRRSSLAPGLGAGTEIRALSSDLRYVERLGAIKSSPPGTPDRSQSPSPGELSTPAHNDTLEQYRLSNVTEQPASGSTSTSASVPRTASRSHAVPAFGARKSTTASSGAPLSRRRPQTSATSKGFGQPVQRGSMALPPGSGLGGLQRNRPGWEADEVVSNLRTSGLEGVSDRSLPFPFCFFPFIYTGAGPFPPVDKARCFIPCLPLEGSCPLAKGYLSGGNRTLVPTHIILRVSEIPEVFASVVPAYVDANPIPQSPVSRTAIPIVISFPPTLCQAVYQVDQTTNHP
jgi:hypothetical protein